MQFDREEEQGRNATLHFLLSELERVRLIVVKDNETGQAVQITDVGMTAETASLQECVALFGGASSLHHYHQTYLQLTVMNGELDELLDTL